MSARYAGVGITAVLVLSGWAAADNENESIPLYGPTELHLDTSRLRPHRLLYDPSSGVGGVSTGLFADGVYKRPQVSISLERTVYHTSRNRVRDAIRVRWSANTHPHVDEIVVDAGTLSIVSERTRSGRNWETKEEVVYLRNGQAQVIGISDEGEPTLRTFQPDRSHHYGLMILPYVFASMDVPDGTRFRLPTIGSSGEGTIDIAVRGPSSFVDNEGQKRTALLVTSIHSWGAVDWYVGPAPPYHLHAVWHFMSDGSLDASAVSQVIDWVDFGTDSYQDVIDHDVMREVFQ